MIESTSKYQMGCVMKLTDGEKIIIGLLSDIHKAMKIKDGLDTDLIMESIFAGQSWAIKWELHGLLDNREPTETQVNETCSILQMWEIIERRFQDLNEAEKIKVRESYFGKDPSFEGFDANNEAQYQIAEHLVRVMGRFSYFKDRNLNSHSHVIERYQNMLERYNEIQKGKQPFNSAPLTVDEIISILS